MSNLFNCPNCKCEAMVVRVETLISCSINGKGIVQILNASLENTTPLPNEEGIVLVQCQNCGANYKMSDILQQPCRSCNKLFSPLDLDENGDCALCAKYNAEYANCSNLDLVAKIVQIEDERSKERQSFEERMAKMEAMMMQMTQQQAPQQQQAPVNQEPPKAEVKEEPPVKTPPKRKPAPKKIKKETPPAPKVKTPQAPKQQEQGLQETISPQTPTQPQITPNDNYNPMEDPDIDMSEYADNIANEFANTGDFSTTIEKPQQSNPQFNNNVAPPINNNAPTPPIGNTTPPVNNKAFDMSKVMNINAADIPNINQFK